MISLIIGLVCGFFIGVTHSYVRRNLKVKDPIVFVGITLMFVLVAVFIRIVIT